MKKSQVYKSGYKCGKMYFEYGHPNCIADIDTINAALSEEGLEESEKNQDDFVNGFYDGHGNAQNSNSDDC